MTKEDIESLGWKEVESGMFFFNHRYRLDLDRKHVEIVDFSKIGPQVLFYGFIENRSGLETIMYMTGIL